MPWRHFSDVINIKISKLWGKKKTFHKVSGFYPISLKVLKTKTVDPKREEFCLQRQLRNSTWVFLDFGLKIPTSTLACISRCESAPQNLSSSLSVCVSIYFSEEIWLISCVKGVLVLSVPVGLSQWEILPGYWTRSI